MEWPLRLRIDFTDIRFGQENKTLVDLAVEFDLVGLHGLLDRLADVAQPRVDARLLTVSTERWVKGWAGKVQRGREGER